MGIRGATGLLSNDLHRFGIPWLLEQSPEKASDGKNNEVKNIGISNTIIFIDGPALLYHLLSSRPPTIVNNVTAGLDSLSSNTHTSTIGITSNGNTFNLHQANHFRCNSDPYPLNGTWPPFDIYNHAYTFVYCLVLAGAAEVHLILEGLAPREKLPEQLVRLSQSSKLCDASAKEIESNVSVGRNNSKIHHGKNAHASFCSAKNVPPLFGEESMIQAFLDVNQFFCNESNRKSRKSLCKERVVFVDYADGEAENHIAQILRLDTVDGAKVSMKEYPKNSDFAVLSNDSDFLVYECKSDGYVPFSSLEMEIEFIQNTLNPQKNELSQNQSTQSCLYHESSKARVKGWKYVRSKFLRQMNLQSYQMPIVAALAGCDYEPSNTKLKKRLICSRRNILQSKIAGLSNKQKKKPTAKSSLISVLRFLSYCHKQSRIKIDHPVNFQKEIKVKLSMVGSSDSNDEQDFEFNDIPSTERDMEYRLKFLHQLTIKIAGSGKGMNERQSELMQALDIVSKSYTTNIRDDLVSIQNLTLLENVNYSRLPRDVRRILQHGIFLCRPVVELCKHNWKNSHSRKKKIKGIHSIWLDPYLSKFRKRFYSLLFHVQSQSHKSIPSYSMIEEYSVDFQKPIIVPLLSTDQDQNWTNALKFVSLSSPTNDMLHSVQKDHGNKCFTVPDIAFFNFGICGFSSSKIHFALRDIMLSMPPKRYSVFFVGIMLLLQHDKGASSRNMMSEKEIGSNTLKESPHVDSNSFDAFFLLSLVSTYPSAMIAFSSQTQANTTCSGRFLRIMSIIQISSYHVFLFLNSISVNDMNSQINFQWHEIFQDDTALICFQGIDMYCNLKNSNLQSLWKFFCEESLQSHSSSSNSFSFALEGLLKSVVRVAKLETMKNLEKHLKDWNDSILMLWKLWRDYHFLIESSRLFDNEGH